MDKSKLLQQALGLIQIAQNITTNLEFKQDCSNFLNDIMTAEDIQSLMEIPSSSAMMAKATINIKVDAVGAKALHSLLESILVRDRVQKYHLSVEENIRVFAEFVEHSGLKTSIDVIYQNN